jgi:phage gpG-like protein
VKVTAGIKLRRLNGTFAPADFAGVLAEARSRVRADIDRAFTTRADPQTGRPWKARSEKGLHTYLHPLLVKTGKLKAEALNAAVAATVSGNRLSVTQRVPDYAGWHQLGTRHMPKRPFLGVSKATQRWLARRLKDQAARAWRDRKRGAYA